MLPYVIPPIVVIHIRPPGCCCFCALNPVYITCHYFQVKIQPGLFLLQLVRAAAFHITSSGFLSVRKSREETRSLMLCSLLSLFHLPSGWASKVSPSFLACLSFSIPFQIGIKKKRIKLAQQQRNSAPTFLPTPSTFVIKLPNIPSTQTNAYICFKISLFSKPCADGSALSRQCPQAQRHCTTRVAKLPSIVEEEEEGGGQSESHRGAAGSRMHEKLSYTRLLTFVHQSEPKGFKDYHFVVSLAEVVLIRAVHKQWCKAFADVPIYKQMDLAQGWVAFQKLSTGTKICVNFNSLIHSAKGEKPKRVLLSSLQYFNNFTIPSGKKDCVKAFPHKAHTGGNLNSAHMWGDSSRVSVPTSLCSSASPSSEMHSLNNYCRQSS